MNIVPSQAPRWRAVVDGANHVMILATDQSGMPLWRVRMVDVVTGQRLSVHPMHCFGVRS